jgi:redox-sensitive bicupin YhaK (pirin superfamily)
MAGMEGAPRELRVMSSRIELADVTGRVLFPQPAQGPWLPFVRFADTMTTGGGDDPEGHTHLEEEVLNYVIAGRVDYEDDAGHRSVLDRGTLELLTAHEETRHKMMGAAGVSGTRWLSVVVGLPRASEGPSHRFQVAPCAAPIEAGDAAQERLLVGPDAPVQSGAGLECVEIGFVREGRCVCPVGAGRRAVAYVFEGTATVGNQELEVGVGALIENAAKIAIQANQGTQVLLASVPRRMT